MLLIKVTAKNSSLLDGSPNRRVLRDNAYFSGCNTCIYTCIHNNPPIYPSDHSSTVTHSPHPVPCTHTSHLTHPHTSCLTPHSPHILPQYLIATSTSHLYNRPLLNLSRHLKLPTHFKPKPHLKPIPLLQSIPTSSPTPHT